MALLVSCLVALIQLRLKVIWIAASLFAAWAVLILIRLPSTWLAGPTPVGFIHFLALAGNGCALYYLLRPSFWNQCAAFRRDRDAAAATLAVQKSFDRHLRQLGSQLPGPDSEDMSDDEAACTHCGEVAILNSQEQESGMFICPYCSSDVVLTARSDRNHKEPAG